MRETRLMAGASPELEAWVAAQEDFELFVAPNGKTKVKCALTDHELLPTLEMCTAYLSGKAYKRAKHKQQLDAFDFSQFEPHIVAHKTDPHLLLCVRTQKTLMRDVTAVQNYVKSRSYQVAVEHWAKGQKKSAVEISKLEHGAKRKKSEADAQEEDDEGEDDDDDDFTAAEFEEMEQLTVRYTSCAHTASVSPLLVGPQSSLALNETESRRCCGAGARRLGLWGQ